MCTCQYVCLCVYVRMCCICVNMGNLCYVQTYLCVYIYVGMYLYLCVHVCPHLHYKISGAEGRLILDCSQNFLSLGTIGKLWSVES